MTTILFVHGTGGRKAAYAETFQKMEKSLQSRRPDIDLVPCLWGDSLGAKLNADGASIPDYQESRGKVLTDEEASVRLWENLYRDSFYEMNQLGMRSQPNRIVPGQLLPGQDLKSRVEALKTNSTLQAKLNTLGIGAVFQQACATITGPDSEPFIRLLETASRPLDEDYAVIARAMVAQARMLCKDQGSYPQLLVDPQLRQAAVTAIEQALSRDEASKGVLFNRSKRWLSRLALGFGTHKVQRKRGAIIDGTYPFAGDILVYQGRGKKIREFIRSQIEHERIKPPIVLLAHSLGGIACVDLLIEADDLRDKVAYLITVGSQAPFFYEIGALQSLPYGEPLPDRFPQWLNIYDLRDFLSYVGNCEGIFAGKLMDVQVDNQQPFPEAHGAYWSNPQTWDAIERVLP